MADGDPIDVTAQRRRGAGVFGVLKSVVVATVVMWGICAVALLIYTRGARAPETHNLTIPEGTGVLIAGGENPLEIPSTWSFLSGDTLQLINRDDVDHWIGPYLVPALDERSYVLQPSLGGSLFCSLHPDGEIRIEVDVRDFDARLTLLPTLLLGPAVGLIMAGVLRVMRLLDEPIPAERDSSADPVRDGRAEHAGVRR